MKNNKSRIDLFWIFAIVAMLALTAQKIVDTKTSEGQKIQYQQIYQKLNTIENKIDTLRFD